MLWVIRAIRKLMLWYLEQKANSCYGIQSNKEIHANGNSSNKEINAPVSGTNFFFGNFGFEPNFPTKLEKNQNVALINALIGSIFWNKNISCHGT